MRCHQCGHDNEAGTGFCTQCGNAVTNACPACGAGNAEGSKFCGQCGSSLGSGTEVPATVVGAPAGSSPPEAVQPEHRQLTVMFCDVVGSTELSQKLDPEDLREVLHAYQRACAEVVERFDGQIVQYLGDGILVYFGHPHAHEDDPVRAGHAALVILEAIDGLNNSLEAEFGVRIAVRLGIHTGPAVVGEVGTGEESSRLAIGETPNLAARLHGGAMPGTVVVSDATYRLVKGFFTTEEIGHWTLKGIAEPMLVYRLLAGSGARSRLEARGYSDLPPLVGREHELEVLMERWAQAEGGRGQIAALSGEAGIGKSRLVEAFKERLSGTEHRILECGCSPFHSNTAWYAVVDMVQRWAGFSPDDSARGKVRKLESAVAGLPSSAEDVAPLLLGLLDLPVPDHHESINLDAAGRRKRTVTVLLEILEAVTRERPVLWVVEDVHWADPSTLELLGRWSELGQEARMLVLLNYRPDFTLPWEGAHIVELDLAGLGRGQSQRIIENVTGGKKLPPELVDRIVSRTDGIPLFIEETTKALLESGHLEETATGYELAGPLPAAAIAPTLRDALTARLDRLGSGKALVQLAAVIGREFAVELLHAVSGHAGWSALQAELTRVVESGLLVRRGTGPQATYMFRHALVQDTAYESLLRKTRRAHHRRIKEVLESRFPETAEHDPELLARHCTEAGSVDEAIPYWLSAGRQSNGRAAFSEAIHHLRRGLELLRKSPETPERDHTELWFQTDLGGALQASRGYAAPEVDEAYTRARELAGRVGTPEELLPLLRGQNLYYAVRGTYGTARDVSQHMLALARKTGEDIHVMEAHLARGTADLYVGDLLASKSAYEEAIADVALADSEARRPGAFLGRPAAMGYSYLARTLWILGEVDRALESSSRGLELAREGVVPLTVAQCLGMHSLLYLVRRENDQALDYATQTIAYSTEHGLPYWIMLGSMYESWLMAQEGQVEEGIARFQMYLDGYQATGARLGLTWFLPALGEMYSQMGQTGKSFELLRQAKSQADETGERYYEAEIHRLEGELHLLEGGDGPEAAEACFQRAIEVARGQSARSWELRACSSLARLWGEGGRRGEAHELLSGIYGRFDQGFDTPDLKDALALLESLSPA